MTLGVASDPQVQLSGARLSHDARSLASCVNTVRDALALLDLYPHDAQWRDPGA